MSTSTTDRLAELRRRLPELMPRDQHRLGNRLAGARKLRDPAKLASVTDKIGADLERALARVSARQAAVPAISYPEQLPVSARKDEIAEAIANNQVVIVAGETGSGKTTQLPKICLELGRGVRGAIGHTQPRRIAARTVSERIAEELGDESGEVTGYKVRFTDSSGENTLVKVMTDGILLAEVQNDRQLRGYDTIIIDEAHERSLNIDFLLGYLQRLLPQRPDLKVIVTSATIDPERFAEYFGDAPIIEVSGRTYPVEVRYRPVADPEDPEAEERDQVAAIGAAVDELRAEGPGDILVFLSGEREIRDTADALARKKIPDTEVLPLYARLSSAEQHRVFAPHRGRRIVLATNVAETSLTVPGIRYVIDPGTARISRYSNRLKVQRLPIEPVSQASANQRKGRCGRLSDGICIRLYAEQDFESRPEFTDPEILRTNLASVILQMAALGLGDIASFGFVDPPDRRAITDGITLLTELGAFDAQHRLTETGRALSQLPVDPRMGRMILGARDGACAREVLIIAAALSIQDPRERPAEHQQAADAAHARFRDPDSDFLAYLNLWNYLREQQRELSGSRFRKLCRNEFLNYLRVREWQDIYAQLKQLAKPLGVVPKDGEADPKNVHIAILSGLLSHIGVKEGPGNEYLGARGAKFGIFPGSGLFKKAPRWVMSAELVETTRLWARENARIEPEWVEPLAEHLVKRNHSEPHWSKKAAAVLATERVTLYGVPIVTGRKVNYGRINPEESRELFIRHALVDGEWETHHEFFAANRKLLAEVEELEHRARRRDILVDDEELFEFYDERIPAEVVSGRHFDSWWKKKRRTDPDLLNFEKAMLISETGSTVDEAEFPDELPCGEHRLRLTYQFDPGTESDGVTAHIPLAVLNQVSPELFEWQVPGLREELLTALIKSLPKELRRNFVPAPDFARAVLARVEPGKQRLFDALESELRAMTGVVVPRNAWDITKLPGHLVVNYRVERKGKKLAEGADLAALKQQLRPSMAETLSDAAGDLERSGLTGWTIGELPKSVSQRKSGFTVTGYPALVDEGDTVAVRLLESAHKQRLAMLAGTRKLLLLNTPSPSKYALRHLDGRAKLVLGNNPHGGLDALVADCVNAVLATLIAEAGGPAWDAEGFAKLTELARSRCNQMTLELLRTVCEVLAEWQAVEGKLTSLDANRYRTSLSDVRAQVDGLVHKRFIATTGIARMPALVRYLRAVRFRLEKLPRDPERDLDWTEDVRIVAEEYRKFLAELPPATRTGRAAREIRWMIEEFRVSLFAQELKAAYPVSAKRIYRAMDQLQ
ncbi:ATP-dependent RNA helicase HrpA [Sciscionella sediminilitoris]|uniref:ATP-dependent RNA helicase HrpA n=1 Tax=Sciscionella sediminilitoris TaxID=1445613 RepID=UPI0004DF44D5|nr:ATP-dependent RNA helicase HrpA [Sciscionella sp. SE31]